MLNESEFQNDLSELINKYSYENESNTPDFLLAEYLSDCLVSYNKLLNKRNKWYGRKEVPGTGIINIEEEN